MAILLVAGVEIARAKDAEDGRQRGADESSANGPREPDAEHHLALRYDPEPAIRASTDSVRAELARLKGVR